MLFPFPLLRSYQGISPGPRHRYRFYGEELLAPRPNTKLEDHALSAVRFCLFNIFAVTLHSGGRSSTRNLRKRYVMVTGIHLSWQTCHILRKFLLTLGDRMNFVPLTEPNPPESLGWLKVSQQIDAEKYDSVHSCVVCEDREVWNLQQSYIVIYARLHMIKRQHTTSELTQLCFLLWFNFAGAHPDSWSMGTGGAVPAVNRAVKLQAHLHLVPSWRMRGSTFPLPFVPSSLLSWV